MWVQASGKRRSSWPEATDPLHADRIERGVSIGRPWSDGGCTCDLASVECEKAIVSHDAAGRDDLNRLCSVASDRWIGLMEPNV